MSYSAQETLDSNLICWYLQSINNFPLPSRIVEIEERALKYSRGKNNLVLCGRVVGVHSGRGHAPSGPINRQIQFSHIVDEAVVTWPKVVAEVVVGHDAQVLIFFLQLKIVKKYYFNKFFPLESTCYQW